jgi:hypothetical protein
MLILGVLLIVLSLCGIVYAIDEALNPTRF